MGGVDGYLFLLKEEGRGGRTKAVGFMFGNSLVRWVGLERREDVILGGACGSGLKKLEIGRKGEDDLGVL